MTKEEITNLITQALHEDCGGDNCGADEFHQENAETVFNTLHSAGVLAVTDSPTILA